MQETDRLLDQYMSAFNGDPWYGFPLMRIVSDVPAEVAARHPIPSAHSIWEIVLHIAAWEGAVRERLQGGSVVLPREGDWPQVQNTGEEAWQAALEHLRVTHDELAVEIRGLDPGRLYDRLGEERDMSTGAGHDVYSTLQGITQHNVYHAGQIALLQK